MDPLSLKGATMVPKTLNLIQTFTHLRRAPNTRSLYPKRSSACHAGSPIPRQRPESLTTSAGADGTNSPWLYMDAQNRLVRHAVVATG
jgi:hypothetical protein